MKHPAGLLSYHQALDSCGELFEGETWNSIEIVLKEIKDKESNYDVYLLAAEVLEKNTAEDANALKILTDRINLDLKKIKVRFLQSLLQKVVFEDKVPISLQNNQCLVKIPYFLIVTPFWDNAVKNNGVVEWNSYEGLLLFQEDELAKSLQKKLTPVYRDYLTELGTPEMLAIRDLCRTLRISFIQGSDKEKVMRESAKIVVNVPETNLSKLVTFMRRDR
ncbi:MAG: hypothetical protein JNK42_02255 [Caedimonas sp.]|nr:hypothetical protein [Caedimonas sp.]